MTEGGERQMKRNETDLFDAFVKVEEQHMNKILMNIDIPKPHRLGHMVLYTDYLQVVAELYAQVLTYQQLVDNLQKQNRYLIAKMQNSISVDTTFNGDSREGVN